MLRLRLSSLAAALCLVLVVQPALAQEVSAADRARIQARIDGLAQVIESGDLAGAIGVVPPRLQQGIATRFGVTVDQLKPAMQASMAEMMRTVTIEDYGMDLAAATVLATPNGARSYLLVPTYTVMNIQGTGRLRADSQTLVFEDGGEWYLVRTEQGPQLTLLREIYPEFAEVQFPAGRMSPVAQP